jgi:hypothetical protein
VAQALASKAEPIYRLNGPWPPKRPRVAALSELGEVQVEVMDYLDRILEYLREPA